ncbi:MAG: cobalamin-dependent protein [Anaerolineales bacterium]|nr:cobalamin-dependent protein [Anaerolineales bacterium]
MKIYTGLDVFDAIAGGEMKSIDSLISGLLEEGISPEVLLNQWMIPAMDKVGVRFEKGELYVPEMLMSACTMQAGLKQIRPLLVESGVKPEGKILLATVKGDLHDIGKNLVGMMLEGAGYAIIDLGVNVGPEAIVEAVRTEQPDVLGLSALLTTTMTTMQTIMDQITDAGLREKVKVVIGGAPVNQAFADEIGADGFGRDAGQAVQVVRALMKNGRG